MRAPFPLPAHQTDVQFSRIRFPTGFITSTRRDTLRTRFSTSTPGFHRSHGKTVYATPAYCVVYAERRARGRRRVDQQPDGCGKRAIAEVSDQPPRRRFSRAALRAKRPYCPASAARYLPLDPQHTFLDEPRPGSTVPRLETRSERVAKEIEAFQSAFFTEVFVSLKVIISLSSRFRPRQDSSACRAENTKSSA